QEHSADLNDGEHRDDDFRNHWHEHSDGVAFAEPEAAEGICHAIDLLPQFLVRERTSGSVFSFGFNRRLFVGRRIGVFIEHVVDDVHFAVDAPFCPRFAFAQIDNARVLFVKLNVEIAQNAVPEPGDIGRRSSHQLLVRTESMFLDESLEVRFCNQLRCWPPDEFPAELKLAHQEILLGVSLQGNRTCHPVAERRRSGCRIIWQAERLPYNQGRENSGASLIGPMRIWTIGHSTRTIDEFISLLEENGVKLLADVRAWPGSKRYPQFNKEALAESVDANGI